MKKIALILLTLLLMVGCDDYNKRDTPGVIDFTLWESISKPEPEAEEHYYLKFYETTFDLLYQRIEKGEIIESQVHSGQFTYRMPKIRLIFGENMALQGIVTGKSMLFVNGLVLDLTYVDAF